MHQFLGSLRWLFRYLHHYRYFYLLGIISVTLTNWFLVFIPEYIQKAIDQIDQAQKSNTSYNFEFIILIFVFSIIVLFLRVSSRISFFNSGRFIENKIKSDLLANLLTLPKSYFDKSSSGEIISKINNDITGVRLICGFGLLQCFNIITALSFTPYKMYAISPEITLYCLLPLSLALIIVSISTYFLRRNTKLRMKELQSLSTHVLDTFNGLESVKNYAVHDWVSEKFDHFNELIRKRSLKLTLIRAFSAPILDYLDHFLKIIILLFGGYLVISNELTIGQIVALLSYSVLLTLPISSIGWLLTLIQAGLVGLESLQSITDEKPIDNPPRQKSDHTLNDQFEKHGITIQNLKFRYDQESRYVLDDVSLTIPAGKTIGILGEIGSGKTTLVNCLNKYLQSSDNEISLGNSDINQINNQQWREMVVTIPQKPFLFSDSILENIRFIIKEHDQTEPIDWSDVLFKAALKDEIATFPDKENSLVGEKGIMLSGGQKQRISMARAFIKSCDLLILDNVMSAVDYKTEQFLFQQIQSAMSYKSLLIVSHRIRTLQKADYIYVLKEGKIIEHGSFDSLLENQDYFYKTYLYQNANQTNDALI